MVQKVSLLELQFGANDDPKLRRLAAELRRMQQTVNSLIEASQAPMPSTSELPFLPAGQWSVDVIAGSSPTFIVRYNDGSTIRSGSITLT